MPMHCHGGVMMLTAWRCLCWRYWRRHNIQTIKANYRGEPGLADEARDHSPDAERHENSAPSVVTPRCRIKHSLWLLGHTSHKSRAWIRRIPLIQRAIRHKVMHFVKRLPKLFAPLFSATVHTGLSENIGKCLQIFAISRLEANLGVLVFLFELNLLNQD